MTEDEIAFVKSLFDYIYENNKDMIDKLARS